MNEFEILHQKARCFYEEYERKGENRHQTHYCPGCGHGIAHKLIAQAIDELGVQDRTVLVSPVGCSVFAYYYFDTGNVQVAHGRAPAAATGVKRALPESIVISYQGDGDLAAIGSAEILHAANRGENITVFFLNNAIYGMTGGQMAPTTLIGQKSTTTPFGRDIWNEGYPLHVCEVLASLEAPVYLERVGFGSMKQIMSAKKAVRRALETQVRGLGFSLIEILSPCPTIWKMKPVEAQRWVNDELSKVYPLGVFRDRTKEAVPRPAPQPPPAPANIPKILGVKNGPKVRRESLDSTAPCGRGSVAGSEQDSCNRAPTIGSGPIDVRIKVAGFGGQGVLMLGQLLAEAGLDAGLEVSWLPSYGPEMRSGTSHCHVRLSSRLIDSPLVTRPNVLLAMNEPSLRKFADAVQPAGWIFYNGRSLPPDFRREGIEIVARPFTELADAAGDARAGNVAMLGALLECTGILHQEQIETALARLVKGERWLEIDRKALECGRNAVREGGPG